MTGCIAAYKCAYLVRLLKKEGAEVKVVMTSSAQKFITKLTMETLSDNQAYTDMFPKQEYFSTHHISLAEWADLILIAPASGNIIGKIANGIADDLLTTIVMAAQSPVMIAPTMNTHMYQNPAVQENMNKLRRMGYHFVEPGVGELACKTYGVGRLAEPDEIAEALVVFFESKADLDGLKVLISAGPTVEYIDAVRYISNPSSGKMGYALAQKAANRGAEVTLVSGPVSLDAPEGVNLIEVFSGAQMCESLQKHFADADMLFMAAAVGDYAPSKVEDHKIKKTDQPLTLTLIPQTDILKKLSEMKTDRQVMVGFALETDNIEENAQAKLANKKLEMIVVNDPHEKGAAFRVDTNKVTIIDKNGKTEQLSLMTKLALADIIIDKALKFRKSE